MSVYLNYKKSLHNELGETTCLTWLSPNSYTDTDTYMHSCTVIEYCRKIWDSLCKNQNAKSYNVLYFLHELFVPLWYDNI